VNKVELVKTLTERVSKKVPKVRKEVVEATVNELFELIKEEVLSGREVSIREFGRFYLKKTSPRTARNPKTGEKVKVKARKRFTFKPSPKIKFVEE